MRDLKKHSYPQVPLPKLSDPPPILLGWQRETKDQKLEMKATYFVIQTQDLPISRSRDASITKDLG